MFIHFILNIFKCSDNNIRLPVPTSSNRLVFEHDPVRVRTTHGKVRERRTIIATWRGDILKTQTTWWAQYVIMPNYIIEIKAIRLLILRLVIKRVTIIRWKLNSFCTISVKIFQYFDSELYSGPILLYSSSKKTNLGDPATTTHLWKAEIFKY